MEDLLSITQIVANIATILGIPLFILLFFRDRKKAQEDKALEAYDRLDERFIDYVKLCLEQPDLDTFEVSLKHREETLSFEEQRMRERKELIMFTILVAIFER